MSSDARPLPRERALAAALGRRFIQLRQRGELVCHICGTVVPNKYLQARYCSPRCSQRARTQRQRARAAAAADAAPPGAQP